MRWGALWLAAALALSAPALAADVGEIALVEDTDGSITASLVNPISYLGNASCGFLGNHADQYDAIFVFHSTPLNAFARTQQGVPVTRAAMGIGRDNSLDLSSRFCTSRLRHAVKGGEIDAFDVDPDVRYTGILFYPLTGVELLAHEFGHQWMASVRFRGLDGIDHCLARGYEPAGSDPQPGTCDQHMPEDFNQHWSYFNDTGSVMYGNRITDLGGGQFELRTMGPKYSPLDQYLMGLRDPSEVPPMFLVDTGDVTGSAAIPVPPGQTRTESGLRMDYTIDDVIRAEGPRVPAREACHWKAAFLIVHPVGAPPTAAQIDKVDAYRRRFESFYDEATDHRGSFDTTLDGRGLGTTTCPGAASPIVDGGVMPGRDGGVEPPLLDASSPDAGSHQIDAEAPDLGSADAAKLPSPRPMIQDAGFVAEPRVLETADCDCRATPSPIPSSAIGWLLLLVAAARRRR